MPAELLRQERLTWPHFKLYDTCRGLQEGFTAASTARLVWLSPNLQEVQSCVALSVDSQQDWQSLAHSQEHQRMRRSGPERGAEIPLSPQAHVYLLENEAHLHKHLCIIGRITGCALTAVQSQRDASVNNCSLKCSCLPKHCC